MGVALGVGLLQWLLAFLALDLTFRLITVEPERLQGEMRRWRLRYCLMAACASLAVGAAQVWLAGFWGLALALLGPIPWWMLWRFGWRKQFTFLYRHDGGNDRNKSEPGL